MRRILVVDDDPSVLGFLKRALEFQGYTVDLAESGEIALQAVFDVPPDLILLDLMMPQMDGFAVLRRLRSGDVNVPVIMLTGNEAPEAQLEALDSGADDYVVKPVNFDLLVGHIEALLRRIHAKKPQLLRYHDLVMNLATSQVTRNAKHIDLTAREFKTLQVFLERPNRVTANSTLLERVWDGSFSEDANLGKVLIAPLRRKLEKNGQSRLIHNIPNVGYVLRAEEGESRQRLPDVYAPPERDFRMPVLVIDDDPSTRSFLRRGLSFEGFKVVTAESGKEGLRLALEKTPCLILLDIFMLEMNGIELLRRLRAEDHSVPIIMLTANDTPEAQIECLSMGADDYLVKPVNFDVLVKRLRTLLRRTYGNSVSQPQPEDPAPPRHVDPDAYFKGLSIEELERLKEQFEEYENYAASESTSYVRMLVQRALMGRDLTLIWGRGMADHEDIVPRTISRLRNQIEAHTVSN